MFTLLAVAVAVEVSTKVPITSGTQFCGWDGKSAIELSYTQGSGWLVVDSNESLTVTVGSGCTPGAECSNLKTWYAQYLDGVFFIGSKRAVVRIFASRDRDVSFAAGYLNNTAGQCTSLHVGALPSPLSKGTHCVVNSQLRETSISGQGALPAGVTVNVYSTDGSVTEFKPGTQLTQMEGRLSTAIQIQTDGTALGTSVRFDFNEPPYSQASLTQTSKDLPEVAFWPASGSMLQSSLIMGSCERAAYCSTPIHFEGGDIPSGENLALDVGLALGIPAAFGIFLCGLMIGLSCKCSCSCSCQRQESVQETFDLPPPNPDFTPPNPDTLQP